MIWSLEVIILTLCCCMVVIISLYTTGQKKNVLMDDELFITIFLIHMAHTSCWVKYFFSILFFSPHRPTHPQGKSFSSFQSQDLFVQASDEKFSSLEEVRVKNDFHYNKFCFWSSSLQLFQAYEAEATVWCFWMQLFQKLMKEFNRVLLINFNRFFCVRIQKTTFQAKQALNQLHVLSH